MFQPPEMSFFLNNKDINVLGHHKTLQMTCAKALLGCLHDMFGPHVWRRSQTAGGQRPKDLQLEVLKLLFHRATMDGLPENKLIFSFFVHLTNKIGILIQG